MEQLSFSFSKTSSVVVQNQRIGRGPNKKKPQQLSFCFFISKPSLIKKSIPKNSITNSSIKENVTNIVVSKPAHPVSIVEIQETEQVSCIQTKEDSEKIVIKRGRPKKEKKVFKSVLDDGFDAVLKKACSYYYYNNRQFNFISSDPSLSFDDMVGECYLNAIKKGIFKNKELNESVIFYFVKQVFITKAIYQTRHFKDVLLKDENYENKKIVLENRYNERNKDNELDMKELKKLIEELSDRPVIDGFFVYKDLKLPVSLKSLFYFIYNGFNLRDILNIYDNDKNTYQKKYIGFILHSMYDTGEVELKRLAGTFEE